MSLQTIQPGELYNLQTAQKIWLVDVRTPAEFQGAHLSQAFNHPLSALGPQKLSPPPQCAGTLYLICQSGTRARQAAQRLSEAGQTDVCLVEGGMLAWQSAGLPVVSSGSGFISLERQVRIATGMLVLLGVTLNRGGLDWGVYLSATVGLGLVFSGITDSCGMAMLLSQMPWNRGSAAKSG